MGPMDVVKAGGYEFPAWCGVGDFCAKMKDLAHRRKGKGYPIEIFLLVPEASGWFVVEWCEECAGSGMQMRHCPTDKWPNSEVASDCPDCDGHGWTITKTEKWRKRKNEIRSTA